MTFNTVVCGGTFDHFHKGHEEFLRCAFSVGKRVIVGVTSDDYVKKSNIKNQISKIEPFEKRKKAVLEFIKTQEVSGRAEIMSINDLFGPTLSKELIIDVIVVSESTRKGAEIINEERKKLGLKELNLIFVPQVLAEDGKIISSGRIRKGEINREGKSYVKPLWLKKGLMLPENLRGELKKPFGELLTTDKELSEDKNNLVITVGDITAKTFNKKSLGQNISVIDFKVAREKQFSSIEELGFTGDEKVLHVNNPAGYITHSLLEKIAEILKLGIDSKVILQVNGEEDLSVLPLILLSPLDTIIYYGQPGEGLVKIEISEEIKKIAYGLVNRFGVITRGH